MINLDDLQKEAERILAEGVVKYFIGFGKGPNGTMPVPVFITRPEEARELVWNPLCVYNLALFLVEERKKKAKEKNPDTRPVGIIVKGCDSRAINVLLQEKYIKREDVYIIGVSCEKSGVVDSRKLSKKLKGKRVDGVEFSDNEHYSIRTGKEKVLVPERELLADRCLECTTNYPVVYDVLFGDQTDREVKESFAAVNNLERLPPEQRWAFWEAQFKKCIRCYACRSVCPMCYCEECVVDSINFAVTPETTAEEKAQKIRWVERSTSSSENFVYHLVRAIHLAGRCTDCGECERVCPQQIPIRLLNKKLEKEAKELFDYRAGLDPDQPSLVASFRENDPDDFIR